MLSFDVSLEGVNAQDVLLLAIHRAPTSTPPWPPSTAVAQAGYLIGRLLRSGELSGRGEISLRESEREDLTAGRLHVRLFTRPRPLGDVTTLVVLTFR